MRPAGLLLLLSALLLGPGAAPAADNPVIVFRVYDGPVDDPSKKFTYKDVELKPGSKEAAEFVENYGKSNPGLVNAYKKLTEDQKLKGFLGDLLSLTGVQKKVILADDSRKYVDRDKDGKPDTDQEAQDVTHVWPHSAGSYVMISKSYLDTYRSDEALTSVLIHELSHTQDGSNRRAGDYGPDDGHYADEILYNQQLKQHAETAAWVEGWANYTPMLYDPGERRDAVKTASKLRREGERGKYTDVDWKDASYEDLISVELVNSLILYDIARFLPGGKEAILEAFKATNKDSRRNLRDLLAEYIRRNPSQAFAVAAIFDAYTGFKAPGSVLEELLGKEQAERYSKDFRKLLKEKNRSNSLGGAESVSMYAAGNLLTAGAKSRMAEIEQRLEEIDEWKPSPWSWLAPPYILIKKYALAREKARLLAEKRELEKVIRSLEQSQERARQVAKAIVLPPPAAELSDDTSSLVHVHAAAGSARRCTCGRLVDPAEASRAGAPAASVAGRPVDWAR